MRTWLFLTATLTLSPAASAPPVGSPVLVVSRPKPGEPFRFFGGRTVAVPLLICATGPEGLAIRAELVQLTANLSATVAAGLELPLSAPAEAAAGVEHDYPVALPAVKRETDFELRFRSRRQGDGVWQAAGRVALRVYPADLLSPVRAWAESHPLRVEDDQGSVAEFLRGQGIPVAGQPGPRGITLYAGKRAFEKRERFPLRDDEPAVLFTERETETPHLLINRTGRGTTVRVEMRLVDRLATDPLAQKIFLEVFQLLHEQEPPTKGDVR